MKLFLLSALLLPAASAVEAPAPVRIPEPLGAQMPNLMDRAPPGCRTVAQQVADESKRVRGDDVRTLDREPSAHLLLAVDRRVEGCREITFIRRDVGAPPLPGRDRR